MTKQNPWIAGINAVSAAVEHDADNVREVLIEAGAKNPRLTEIEESARRKGNKIIEIPKAKRSTERVVAIAAVAPGATLSVKSGTRTMTLSFKDLADYVGARGSRGGLLPRGWQKVDGLAVE